MTKTKKRKTKKFTNKPDANAAVKRKGKGAYRYKVKGGYRVGVRKK